jgi:CHAT domain-containing protein/tetratricopeptide (TPR) repeat protein
MKKQKLLTFTLLLSTFTFILSTCPAQTWQEADSLRWLYIEQDNIDTALVYAKQALELAEQELGNMDTTYANMIYDLNILALLYYEMGQYDKAMPLFLEVLLNTEKSLGKHLEYAFYLTNLAILYDEMGQYNKAIPLYIEVNGIIERLHGNQHSDYGVCLNNLAVVYCNIGQYNKALPLLMETLEISEKTHCRDHASLCNLANLYQSMGQYDKALPLYLEALENCENALGKEHSRYGTYLHNLAGLYEAMGQYDKALLLYIEALNITEGSVGKEHSYYGSSLNNLAMLYKIMGENDKALTLFLEALENTEKSLGKNHSYYGVRLNNLALLYQSMGQYDKALPMYLEALENTEKALGKEHSKYGLSLNNLAGLYKSMGQYDKALPLYLDALENTENSLGKEHSRYGISLNNLALLYKTMGQYEKALPLFLEAIQNNFHNINQAFSFLAESEKEKFIKTLSGNFSNYKIFFLDYAPENPAVAGYAYNIELATKGMILQAGIQMREAIEQSGDSAALAKYDQWQALRLTIAKQYSQPIEKRLPNLPEMEAEAEALEGELARVSSAFAESQSLGAIAWADIQNVLNPNEACVEFSSFAYRKDGESTDSIMYVALVLLPDSEQPILVPLCEQKQLDSILIKSLSNKSSLNRMYRAAIIPDLNSVDYGKRLYELIWQPLEKYIPENTLVYFAPSGSLHKIAFAAIPIDDNTRLSDKYRIMQLSSTAVLLQESKFKNKGAESIALFGGINYEVDADELLATAENIRSKQDFVSRSVSSDADRGSTTWSYLPGTLQEVNAIENIAIQNNVKALKFTGNAAIEEQFKNLKGNNSPRIIHISTHGFFFEDAEQGEHYNAAKNPLNRAGLLFAGANTTWQGKTTEAGIDDGILTAYEATNVTLLNTELVVLSACETGLGEIKGSEGVFGLQRAFKNAGAEYIIMSLWKVPDAETAEFMEHFYKQLFSGKDIPESFRNTQNYMKQKYPTEPYNWAAFVLVR